MNYIKHLTGFFDKVANDNQLNATHVSIYMALFQFWNCNRFRNPISISRDEVMRISKISSKATYHKCLKALHSKSYINYEPSYNPFKGSHVYLFNFADEMKPLTKNEKKANPNFELANEQVPNKSQTTKETTSEQALEQVVVPYINNTNTTNNLNNSNSLNLNEQAKKIELENNLDFKNEDPEEKEKKWREKKKEDSVIPNLSSQVLSKNEYPTLEQIKTYFQENSFPELESQKFHNYFSSIGWLVGGKIPMTNWQAAAQNWMLNVPKFNPTQQPNPNNHLNTTTHKNYAEPL